MSEFPKKIDLVRKDKSGKWYPIGDGDRTKNGNGVRCRIFPGQKVFGDFFIFEASDKKPTERAYQSAADEYDDQD